MLSTSFATAALVFSTARVSGVTGQRLKANQSNSSPTCALAHHRRLRSEVNEGASRTGSASAWPPADEVLGVEGNEVDFDGVDEALDRDQQGLVPGVDGRCITPFNSRKKLGVLGREQRFLARVWGIVAKLAAAARNSQDFMSFLAGLSRYSR